jgi:hypothetical protein
MNMNDFNEQMKQRCEFDAFLMNRTEEELDQMLLFAERELRKSYPNAKLLFSDNSKGVVTHVGIYDAPLHLNARHAFKAGNQYAPQLLSKNRFDYQEHYPERAKQRIVVEAWMDAASQIQLKQFGVIDEEKQNKAH